ncbi:hypothetical protein PV10_01586 [Exophiala mesophila]|uniref:Uncharacterized protein n=1 Tax=Exophiala mesophila TaxID=212818 RepID=A0A0D1YB75_EXOME|nr:uncharacterized protein PV10_01586 [Exophiala mesophila]KIV97886.1 hypothetical protein PV10_01586 [Exophiala mesophila]
MTKDENAWPHCGPYGPPYPQPHYRVRSYERLRPPAENPEGTKEGETGPQGDEKDKNSGGDGSSKTEETKTEGEDKAKEGDNK